MINLQESLKIRYDAVFESDNNSRFYQNLHHYFDLVIKDPVLHGLYEASENELREKHIAVWERDHKLTDEEADDRAERTDRLERFSLYAVGCFTEAWVYDPLEDYKNAINEPEYDLYPEALVMMKGVENINPEYAKRSPTKWGRENLKRLARRYANRESFENRLKQFHLMLLAEVEKLPKMEAPKEPPAKECPLLLNRRTGDFVLSDVRGTFTPSSKEFKVLLALCESPDMQASHADLIRAAYPNRTEPTKTDRMDLYPIIQGIKEKLKLDVLHNVAQVGYRLVFGEDSDESKQS
ncbi:MAG: hypothetical protein WC050_00105 [Candidatus Paceibacterota bacterium]